MITDGARRWGTTLGHSVAVPNGHGNAVSQRIAAPLRFLIMEGHSGESGKL